MRNYTTQMDAARKSIITPELEKVAAKGTYDDRRELDATGSRRKSCHLLQTKITPVLDPEGIGSMLQYKDQCKSWRLKRL